MIKEKVFVLSKNKFGYRLDKIISSGYDMLIVEIDGVKGTYYTSDAIYCSNYKNYELWRLIETNNIPKGLIVIDQNGTEFVFTGKSFQLYGDSNITKYYGFCKGDVWKLDRIIDFNKELERI